MNERISQLPSAPYPISGSELVPIVQNGQTVQTTTGAIANSPTQTQTFLTVVNEPTLANSRYLSTGVGLGINEGSAQGTTQIFFNGTAGSLEAAGTGIIVKTSSGVITPRQFVASGNGIAIANGDGIAGNPTLSLTGLLYSLANTSGSGLLTVNGSTASVATIQGTNNEITVVNGGSAPVISISNNPTIPGQSFVQLPLGSTAQRGAPSYGALRYNTDSGVLESYTLSAGWGAITSGTGVASFSAGLTGLLPNSPTTGGIILSGTLNTSSGGTGVAGTLTGYVYGNGTSEMTASTTIPTTALSGLVTNSQLANNTVTFNGQSVALGGSGTITAVAPNALTFAASLTGTSSTYNGSAAVTVGVANSGVTAGTYGSSTTTSVITVGVDGRVTAASSSGINLPSGGANEIVVQTSANNTGFISAPSVTNTFLEWNGTGFAWAAASGATTAQALTFNNGGAGAASGTTFNGSVAETISYNTLGAAAANGANASGTWNISISGVAATTSQTNFSDLTINTFQVLSAANFNSYAPTLTGTGASGTWPIGITGNAATATDANNLNLAAGSGATNYLMFSSTAAGYSAGLTNTGLTYDGATNAITGGIAGGSF